MKAIRLLIVATIALPLQLFATSRERAKQYFFDVRQHLEDMLSGKAPISYERAIYEIENAWWEGKIDAADYQRCISYHVLNIQALAQSYLADKAENLRTDLTGTKEEKRKRMENVAANFAIYRYITTPSFWVVDTNLIYHKPYNYSHKDPKGTIDWTNTHVSHLINEGSGNCFAMASLFQIFSERLQSGSRLTTAPSHIYIRHADDKGTIYNVELSNGSFPGTGTLETVTYTTDEALKNSIALRELNLQQSVALCLVYLAKGYEYKFGVKDDFMLHCADKALQYDDHNLNAMLLKAELLEDRLVRQNKTIEQLAIQKDFQVYQRWIDKLIALGYREMPYEMKNILVKGWTKDTVLKLAHTDNSPSRMNKEKLEDTRYASLSWGLFNEDIKTMRLERIGNTVYDTRLKKITGFVTEDVLFNQYDFDPVIFAENIDPLAHKFPWQSPYAAFDNNPIWKNDPSGAAGEIVASGNTLTIYSTMIFYGGAANAKLANIAAANIQNQWNAAGGSMKYNGKTYNDIKFVVTAQAVKEEQAKSMAAMNKGENFDPRLNFARIENVSSTKANEFAGQMGKGKGDNSFFFSTRDLVPGNTSQSHEYGHGLGGDHNANGTFIDGMPNIMSTFYNGVDGNYSEDGLKSVFVSGTLLPLHKMNKDCRTVQQVDINQMYIHDYKKGIGSGSQVGSSSNILYDENGNTVGGTPSTTVK